MPGRKDYVVVVKDGEKVQVQKKILLMNIMEAYQLFKIEHQDVKIGKSKFADLRPAHVKICSDKDQNFCCCVYHENFSMLIDGIKKTNNDIPDGIGFWTIKFLHQHSKHGLLHFLWPERPDVDTVHESSIVCGPISLSGCLDYTVENIEAIIHAFKARSQ